MGISILYTSPPLLQNMAIGSCCCSTLAVTFIYQKKDRASYKLIPCNFSSSFVIRGKCFTNVQSTARPLYKNVKLHQWIFRVIHFTSLQYLAVSINLSCCCPYLSHFFFLIYCNFLSVNGRQNPYSQVYFCFVIHTTQWLVKFN
jgi:hypothetical protein